MVFCKASAFAPIIAGTSQKCVRAYLIGAVGMMVALMTELIEVGIEPVVNWVIGNLAMFLWSLCFYSLA